METLGVIGMLGLCSYEDIKSRELKVIQICLFGIAGLFLHLIIGTNSIESIIGGIVVGAIILGASILSKEKIGKGDGVLIMVIGIYLGFWKTLELLWIAGILAFVIGLILLKFNKKLVNGEIPFVPFLLAGYLLLYMLENTGVVVA